VLARLEAAQQVSECVNLPSVMGAVSQGLMEVGEPAAGGVEDRFDPVTQAELHASRVGEGRGEPHARLHQCYRLAVMETERINLGLGTIRSRRRSSQKGIVGQCAQSDDYLLGLTQHALGTGCQFVGAGPSIVESRELPQ